MHSHYNCAAAWSSRSKYDHCYYFHITDPQTKVQTTDVGGLKLQS